MKNQGNGCFFKFITITMSIHILTHLQSLLNHLNNYTLNSINLFKTANVTDGRTKSLFNTQNENQGARASVGICKKLIV